MKVYYPGLSATCRMYLAEMYPRLIEVAREHGYALAIHGSSARDIDLVAVPWVEKPWAPDLLVEALKDAAAETSPTKMAFFSEADKNPGSKPHGRLCWSIHLGSGVYIDLSVMPLTEG